MEGLIGDGASAVERKAVRSYGLALLLLTAACTPLLADSGADLFKQGNASYQAGKFPEAITAYQNAEKQGLRHWNLFYNLGNAYYRNNQVGLAIASYERAFRLNSGDGDLIYNLSLASTKAGDPRLPSSGLATLFWRLFYWPGINALTLLASVGFWIVAAGLILKFLRRPTLPVSVLQATAAIVLFFGAWMAGRAYESRQPLAIVISPVAEVRSGPNMTYPANFTVPEGHRLLVLVEQEPVSGWVEVGVPEQGLKGWVPDSVVAAIEPLL